MAWARARQEMAKGGLEGVRRESWECRPFGNLHTGKPEGTRKSGSPTIGVQTANIAPIDCQCKKCAEARTSENGNA